MFGAQNLANTIIFFAELSGWFGGVGACGGSGKPDSLAKGVMSVGGAVLRQTHPAYAGSPRQPFSRHSPRFHALTECLYADKVRRARAAPATQKMGWGAELFADACVRMSDGIRAQFPAFGPDEVKAMLLKRLKRLRQLDEHGIYQRTPPP